MEICRKIKPFRSLVLVIWINFHQQSVVIKYLRRITSFCHEITIKVYSNIHALREGVVFKNGAWKKQLTPRILCGFGRLEREAEARKNKRKKIIYPNYSGTIWRTPLTTALHRCSLRTAALSPQTKSGREYGRSGGGVHTLYPKFF